MKEKVHSEDSGGRVSDLIDDEGVLMEDDFYTTNSGRQVRRKLICIDVTDPLADKLNDIGDVDKVMPGYLPVKKSNR